MIWTIIITAFVSSALTLFVLSLMYAGSEADKTSARLYKARETAKTMYVIAKGMESAKAIPKIEKMLMEFCND